MVATYCSPLSVNFPKQRIKHGCQGTAAEDGGIQGAVLAHVHSGTRPALTILQPRAVASCLDESKTETSWQKLPVPGRLGRRCFYSFVRRGWTPRWCIHEMCFFCQHLCQRAAPCNVSTSARSTTGFRTLTPHDHDLPMMLRQIPKRYWARR